MRLKAFPARGGVRLGGMERNCGGLGPGSGGRSLFLPAQAPDAPPDRPERGKFLRRKRWAMSGRSVRHLRRARRLAFPARLFRGDATACYQLRGRRRLRTAASSLSACTARRRLHCLLHDKPGVTVRKPQPLQVADKVTPCRAFVDEQIFLRDQRPALELGDSGKSARRLPGQPFLHGGEVSAEAHSCGGVGPDKRPCIGVPKPGRTGRKEEVGPGRLRRRGWGACGQEMCPWIGGAESLQIQSCNSRRFASGVR